MTAAPLELWGGVECSLVRVGDEFRNQVEETGHSARLSDIDAIAELGIKAVRYPILWETVAPESPNEPDFSWHDPRLRRLKDHGIRVVAGLLHHGSGPRYTDLLDPHFPTLFASYARSVAKRYPWIDCWTPINEPLTTARMSFLYGTWFPHKRSFELTLRALVNQCAGIAAAMKALRDVNPAVQLLQTEDVGKTFSTEKLAYQAEHENERRWLTFDLLSGRLRPGHRFYDWLLRAGITREEIGSFADGSSCPDILGFDHYLTSERYLDHRTGRYPGEPVGTNGREAYVDVEAVRIAKLNRDVGPEKRLAELWDRYRLPIAITEVHHGCTREEQVRWLKQMWRAAESRRANGADIRAVTLWALFGVVDWRSMLTRREGIYEIGAFDIRSPVPRPTLVAKAAARLGAGKKLDHPVLQQPGWWQRPGRTYRRLRFDTLPPNLSAKSRPLLIAGASGSLGQAFSRICSHRGLAFVLTGRPDLDITQEHSIAAAIDRHKPWAIINAAGFTPSDGESAQECFRIHVTGPELLARACKRHALPLVTFSSALVFDGSLGRSYVEPDRPAPSSTVGECKAEAEQRLLAIDGQTLIVRTSTFFGPWDHHNFLFTLVAGLKKGNCITVSSKLVVSPTYLPDLVHATLDLLLDEEKGIWHLTNQGAISWHDLALEIADRAKLDRRRIILPEDEKPADMSLTSSRGLLLRPLERALDDFLRFAEPVRELR